MSKVGSNASGAVSRGIDFSRLTQVTADDLKVAGVSRGGNSVYGISLVNTSQNGKRCKLTQGLHEVLGKPKKLQFVTDGDYLIIGETIPYCTEAVAFSKGTGTNIIYDSGFVHFLTSRFNLDFSGRTSIAFRDVEVETQEFEDEEITFARIKMSI